MSDLGLQAERGPSANQRSTAAGSPWRASPNGQASVESDRGMGSAPPRDAGFWRGWRASVGPAILISVGCLGPGGWGADLAGGAATKARDAAGTTSSPLPDKSRYNLFDPTPAEFMREMNTDRPDKTEGPFTVDAGHFQLEMDVVSYTHDRDTADGRDIGTDALAYAPLNIRVGLLDAVEFDFMSQTFNQVRISDHATGAVQRMSGYGDITLRFKYNFLGNDGGPTAFGVIPFVKLPSNQDHLGNHAVEGGVILPLALDLPHGWDAGMMTELDWLQNESTSGHHATFINSITFGHNLYGRLRGYAEFYSEVSAESGAGWIGTVDFGLTYKLAANVQLDTGLNTGVTKAAPDLNPFVGLSWRL